MKAARLLPEAASLQLMEIDDPVLLPGSVIVRLEAAFASHFITKLVDGSGGYTTPPRPFTPGMYAVGIVEAHHHDVAGPSVGTRVYCDVFYEPRYPGNVGERAFLGNFGLGPGSDRLLATWPDGVYAEKICLPADCVIPLDSAVSASAAVLSRLGWLGTAYGAFRRITVPTGATIAVNGASGLLGSSAVTVALALGASQIFALGRRKNALDAVAAIDSRIVAVTSVDDIAPVDVVLSSVDGPDSSSLETLLPRLKRSGSLVIVGAPKSPFSVSAGWLMAYDITIRGSLWFERNHILELMRLARAGLLPLSAFTAQTFPLSNIADALEASKHRPNPLQHVAILCH